MTMTNIFPKFINLSYIGRPISGHFSFSSEKYQEANPEFIFYILDRGNKLFKTS